MIDVMINRPKIAELYSGAGGAGYGYWLAGFDVTGVDIKPQPNYPFKFIKADALEFDLSGFDAVHASPECQGYCYATKRWRNQGKVYPDQLSDIRRILVGSGLPYVIENVPTAPLINPIYLEGTTFGLGVIKRRGFETNFRVSQPRFRKRKKPRLQPRKRNTRETVKKSAYCQVAGNGADGWSCRLKDWQKAIGIDWMNREEIVKAIPPAYTEYVGRYLVGILH